MDEISDQMHALSRELDTLDEDCVKYQVEGNRKEDSASTFRSSNKMIGHLFNNVPTFQIALSYLC